MSTYTLYRFFDRAEALLYVGITSNPARRLEKHRGTKSWWADVARIDMQHYPDRKTLLEAERTAIQTEKPQHNVRMNGGGASSIPTERLPKGLELGIPYALGLDDGTCPVGIISGGDSEGVILNRFSWLTGSFVLPDEWFPTDAIVRWVRGFEMNEYEKGKEGWDPKRTVFRMDELGDFQTKWLERHEGLAQK